MSNMKEKINHPQHYNPGTYEAINVIEAYDLDFCLGNAIKYILRAGRKDESAFTEDLEKALWYINRRIGHQDTDRTANNAADLFIQSLSNKFSVSDIQTWFDAKEREALPDHAEVIIDFLLRVISERTIKNCERGAER